MAEDYSKRIESTREVLAEARDALVDSYLGRVKELYVSFDETRKNFIQGRLEKLIEELEAGTISISRFDSYLALEARKKAGISQTYLAKKLDLARTQLCRFEKGQGFSLTNPQGKQIIEYLSWLKEQGYNPYNI
ncbi:MAG: helix-turn-helix transcriptional regulator [Nanoarchaeota archaeon]